MTQLIITEKPSAMKHVAEALADKKVTKKKTGKSVYYEITHNGKEILVGCAVGHLFNLKEKNKNGWKYPVLEYEWAPSHTISKVSAFTKEYVNTLASLSKKADEFIVATDYDLEGSLIGYNVIRFICKKKDGKRMKFSMMTKDELVHSYENAFPHLDFQLIESGETRHIVDFLFGINLSRALTLSIKAAINRFKIMSSGRVQGPALKILAERELEIQKFIPVPYWQLFLINDQITASHKQDKFFNQEEVNQIYKKIKNEKQGKIVKVSKREFYQEPPNPFDLTSLQLEAYSLFRINPKQTLEIAQELYTSAYISYPRTSSNQLPPELDYNKILTSIAKQKEYEKLVKIVLAKKNLAPNNGKKQDPAHPAIHPTGEIPKKLDEHQRKIYDLIVKRTIASFGDKAKRETSSIEIDVKNEIFTASGTKTVEKGWHVLYEPYVKQKEEEFPFYKENEIIKINKIDLEQKETQPPKRYTPASIIKELEDRQLGTKCIFGDSILFSEYEKIKIEDLFNKGTFVYNVKDVEVRSLKEFKSISMNEENNSLSLKEPKLISRRLINENEHIIEITSDLSKIKVTEDHLIYVYRNKNLCLVHAKDIQLSDFLISAVYNKNIPKKLINQNILEVSNCKIQNNQYIHKFSSAVAQGISIEKLPLIWSNELAWLLGYYYGDGSYSSPKYNGSHSISFTTVENKALSQIENASKSVFGVNPYSYLVKQGRQYKINLNAFMSSYLVKSLPHITEKKQINIPDEYKADFLRGFFDADGNIHLRKNKEIKIYGESCISHSTPRVKITLARQDLIKWISSLLSDLNIKHNKILYGKIKLNNKYFDAWTLHISSRDNVEKFAREISFSCDYKRRILLQGLTCSSPKYKIISNKLKIVKLLHNCQEIDINYICKILNLSKYKSLITLNLLFKEKIISKRRIRTKENWNNWLYSIKDENYLKEWFKVLYKSISNSIYTVPINSIVKIKPEKNTYVYDLSVDEESPNFIINGYHLVHNSTRASIIESLYNRDYVKDQSLEVTSLGLKTIETLEKYCPDILDEEFTRKLENDMEEITEKKNSKEKVVNEAKEDLTKILSKFKKNELAIGKALGEANLQTQEESSLVGKCNKCENGNLRLIYNKRFKSYFVGCSNYPECKNIFSLPSYSLPKPTKELCKECNFPLIKIIKKGKRPYDYCINKECPAKKRYLEEMNKEQPKES